MFKEYFIFLLLVHILGDFYIQTSNMAEKKEESIKWVLVHCLYYWATILVLSIPILSWRIVLIGIIMATFHTLIDVWKCCYVSKLKRKNRMTLMKERNIFFIDQSLHLICLVLISYLLVIYNISISICSIFVQFFNTVGISKIAFVYWGAALLIIHKPANIGISKLLAKYKPESSEAERKKDKNAGRFIGTIERIIILILISIGQYAAIGLVLTAKSIARYDKISNEPDFAEYYLLGTLLSTLIVIIISFIL